LKEKSFIIYINIYNNLLIHRFSKNCHLSFVIALVEKHPQLEKTFPTTMEIYLGNHAAKIAEIATWFLGSSKIMRTFASENQNELKPIEI